MIPTESQIRRAQSEWIMKRSSCAVPARLLASQAGVQRVAGAKCLETSESRYMTNFKGVHAKINRASDEISWLKRDMDRFCENIRQSIVHEVHKEAAKQIWVYRGETREPPIEWSVRLGEILYNLRSALDHLVWQLVLANEQKPGRRNAFPIVNDEGHWQNATRRLTGVTPRVEAVIERLQPYTGGLGFLFDVSKFWTLNELCNIDKHRHLHFMIGVSDGIARLSLEDENLGDKLPMRGRGLIGKIAKDKVLLRFSNPERKVKPSFQVNIRFEDIEDPEVTAGTVPNTLDECLKTVRGAVELLIRRPLT